MTLTTFRADLIVQNSLLVEVKSVDKLAPIHDSQVLTYLKLTGLPVGLLLNFNETLLKNGIKRLANGF
jgi:GxxExxY protein